MERGSEYAEPILTDILLPHADALLPNKRGIIVISLPSVYGTRQPDEKVLAQLEANVLQNLGANCNASPKVINSNFVEGSLKLELKILIWRKTLSLTLV